MRTWSCLAAATLVALLAAISLAYLTGSSGAAASAPFFTTHYSSALKGELQQVLDRDLGPPPKGWPRGTTVYMPSAKYARYGNKEYVIVGCEVPATGGTDCVMAFERSLPGAWHFYTFAASLLPARCGALERFFPHPALVAWGICTSGKASASAAAGGTSIHLYTPFSGNGPAKGDVVSKTVAGYCWTGSSETARSTAYRCMVGNGVVDPCFATAPTPAASYVLCGSPGPPGPDATRLLRINLTKKLPPNPVRGAPTRYAPWFVETDSGKWCSLSTGANSMVEGLPISYYCTSGSSVLLGTIKRSASGRWTIFFAASSAATQTPLIGLRSAWW